MATRKTKAADAELDAVKDTAELDPIAAAVKAVGDPSPSGELAALTSGGLVDPGQKVLRQSDVDRLQAEIDALQSVLDYALVRGDATLNNQSSKGFDTLDTTGYWRYTGTVIDNPITNGHGIIINIRYTAYAVQLLFSRTKSTEPVKLLYRMGINMSGTPSWGAWMEVNASAI